MSMDRVANHLERHRVVPDDALAVLMTSPEVTRSLNPEAKELDKWDLVTIVVLAQAAIKLLDKDSKLRDQIRATCKTQLAEITPKGPPWDTHGHGDELGSIFTTGRILANLGIDIRDFASDDVIARARTSLATWLGKEDEWVAPLYLPFVYRAAVALKEASALEERTCASVGKYAQGLIHRFIACHALGSRSQFDATFLCLALLADAKFSTDPLTQREREQCFRIAFTEYEPLLTVCRTTITRAGTDAVGCSGVEVLLWLLENEPCSDLMRAHEDQILATLTWLEDHSKVVSSPRGGQVRLYQTDLFPDRRRYEAWFSALVLQFLQQVRLFMDDQEQQRLKRRFRASLPKAKFAYRDLSCGGFTWPSLLKERFLAKVAEPPGETTEATGNGIILFGPPGTGKTSIAKVIARELPSWQFIELTIADFLVEGEANLFKLIRQIFDDLGRLYHCVVFFDELELFVLERDVKTLEWAAGIVTNVMLPELQKLHDCSYVIPIFATNHVSKLDPAGRRPGRFDYVLPVGPPSREERRRLLESKLEKDMLFVGIEEITKGATLAGFLEWVQAYRSGGEHTPNVASELWQKMAAQSRVDQNLLDQFDADVKQYCHVRGGV